MDKEDLFNYITESRNNFAIEAFKSWIDSSERYYGFVLSNIDKIRSKFRGAKSEDDLVDVIFELEVVSHILSNEGYDVEYEKYGCNKIGRSPDLSVFSASGTEFNVEVKRIREGVLGVKFKSIVEDIVKQIEPIPSKLAFSFVVDDLGLDEEFLNRFLPTKEIIVDFIKEKIQLEDPQLPFDETVDYELPNLGGEMSLILSKPKGKLTCEETSYHGGSFPIFFTQKESNKFGDAIFEKIGQMIPGVINVLVIASDSSTHEKEDLQDAIISIHQLMRDQNETFFIKKGFEGISDFSSQAANLSGVLFKSTWSSLSNPCNYLWNNNAAYHKIPDEIQTVLTGLGKHRRPDS